MIAEWSPSRDHAIVIGAGIAGLVAARALSGHFRAVTVLERDEPPTIPAPRSGVPQGRHIHVLLPGGARSLDRLFPGRLGELVNDGAQRFDYGFSRFHIIGGWMPRVETELHTFSQTRPFLEAHIRRWVSEITNIRVIDCAAVTELVFDRAHSRVCGVTHRRDGHGSEELRAGLVIDATGRNTRLPQWLAGWGFGAVPRSEIGFDLGYATGQFRVPDRLRPDHPMLYVVGRPPRETRVGVVVQVENGLAFGGMGGYQGDYPPADLPGFLAFARSLSAPHVFDVLAGSELLSPIALFHTPASIRRRYSKMPRFPDGLLPIGDSICTLDPAFGQGMTIALREAEALADCLSLGKPIGAPFRREFFRRANAIIDVPWSLSTGENLKYPQTSGRRPLMYPLTRRFKDRIATCGDPEVVTEFYKVLSLTAPPRVLLQPRVVARALGLRV